MDAIALVADIINSTQRQHEHEPAAVPTMLIKINAVVGFGLVWFPSRNCIVSRCLTVKISHFATDTDLYAQDYYRIDGKMPLPIRWMAWESVFIVSATFSL